MHGRWILLVALVGMAIAREQKIRVKGTIICDKKRVKGAKVELMEKDSFDPNDVLKTATSDSQGEFDVQGQENEITTISPFLRITHECHVKKAGCHRVTEYEVPKKYVDKPEGYDMTYVNLDIISRVDKEVC